MSPEQDPAAKWCYVTLKRIREGYTWSIGASPDATKEDMRKAMELALDIDGELRQRLVSR